MENITKNPRNKSLGNAKKNKENEFYTQLTDIEKEMRHYKKYFKNKVILCNCDDPRESAFFKHFAMKFNDYKLKKLIATCYKSKNPDRFSKNDSRCSVWQTYEGELKPDGSPNLDKRLIRKMKSDGDFRKEECIEILKEADIVVTNPPFSLFREYIEQLVKYKKKYIVIGNINAINYKEIFPLIKNYKMWQGNNAGDMKFKVPSHYPPRNTRYWQDEDGQKWRSFGTMCWYTNLDIKKRHEDLILFKKYSKKEYQKYDNYDAINVNKTQEIPIDYKGVMGVPISFMNKFNPDQFEIIGIIAGNIKGLAGIPSNIGKDGPYINGKLKYGRILIKQVQKKI